MRKYIRIPNLFDGQYCDKLIRIWEENHALVKLGDHKLRKDYFIQPGEIFIEVNQRLQTMLPYIEDNWGRISQPKYRSLKIGCYEKGYFFKPHIDHLKKKYDIHCSMSVGLNDPSSYEGGGLSFPNLDSITLIHAKGEGIIFDGFELHEVPIITKGRRFVFIAHFFADLFKNNSN